MNEYEVRAARAAVLIDRLPRLERFAKLRRGDEFGLDRVTD
jgi:hypothetical protein